MMELFPHALEVESLRLSLWVAGWAVIGSLPPGVPWRGCWRGSRFPGKTLLDGLVHLPLVLPPVVIGYTLLVLMGKERASGVTASENHRSQLQLQLERGRSGIRGDGLPAAGAGGTAFDRSGRPGAGDGRSHAGRWTSAGFFYRDAAADPAGGVVRGDIVFRPQPGRIRGDDHVCFQHSGPDPHASAGALHVDAGSGRGSRGSAALHYLGDYGAAGPGRLGNLGATSQSTAKR